MDATELRTMLRSEIDDAAEPYLVADPLASAYVDDAQKMFCRLTEGIEDGRSFTLDISSGEEWYDLDKSILKLRKATNTATGRAVALVNQEKADAFDIRFDGRVGPVRALVLGIEKNAARAWPMPNATATVALEVFRLPRTIEAGDELEVDEQHHQSLLMWAKHRVYDIQDSDLYDVKKSALYEQRFRAYCARARIEQERARRVVGTVAYGGI